MPSTLELFAVLFTVLSVYFAGQNSVHTWWSGIIACILYGFVFFGVQLYADVVLQLFFIGTSALGWYFWSENKQKKQLLIRKLQTSEIIQYGVLCVVTWFVYTSILYYFTDAVSPGWDTAVLILSVIGQLTLMRRKLETWSFWIAVNTICVPLFYSRELYLSSALYCVFWMHAFYAAYRWTKEFDQQATA